MNGTLHGAGERGVGGGTCVGGGVCSVLAPERDVFVAAAAEDKVQVLDQGRRVRFAGRGGVVGVAPAIVPLGLGAGGADVHSQRTMLRYVEFFFRGRTIPAPHGAEKDGMGALRVAIVDARERGLAEGRREREGMGIDGMSYWSGGACSHDGFMSDQRASLRFGAGDRVGILIESFPAEANGDEGRRTGEGEAVVRFTKNGRLLDYACRFVSTLNDLSGQVFAVASASDGDVSAWDGVGDGDGFEVDIVSAKHHQYTHPSIKEGAEGGEPPVAVLPPASCCEPCAEVSSRPCADSPRAQAAGDRPQLVCVWCV